jgi:hypothetical protein
MESDAMRKRCVFTDGLTNKFAFQEYEEGVYCIIGPFKGFTADQDLQNDLEDLCRRYNLKYGHLSQEKYDELTAGRS